jgi:hypothetical protein
MNLITGVISLIVFIGSLVSLAKKGSGFMSTAVNFTSLLTVIMSLAGNWNWWWVVPLVSIVLFLVAFLTAQIGQFVPMAAFLKKFIPLSGVLSFILILTNAIPAIKTSTNISSNASTAIWIICSWMLFFVISASLGVANFLAIILSIVEIIKKNPEKMAIIGLCIVYIIIYMSFSIPETIQWFSGTSGKGTGMWVLNFITIGIGIILGVAFAATTLTNLPHSMTFWMKIKQIFGRNPGQHKSWFNLILKGLGIFAFVGFLVYALIQIGLVQFPYTVGNILTLIIQIICVLAVLFGILRYVMSNPRLLHTIKNNIFVRLIFTIVMVIPCLLIYLTQGMVSTAAAAAAAAGKGASFTAKVQAVAPPKMVLIILAVEILLVSSYIILPMFRKWMYVFTPGGGEYNINQNEKVEGIQSAIMAMRKQIYADITIGTAPLKNVDWEKVFSEKTYLTDDEHTKALTEYLTTLGYRDSYSLFRDNTLITGVLGNPITIKQAVSFIQTKNRVSGILDDLQKLEDLKNNLGLAEEKVEGPADSKILNNKPTYINKKTNIGTYENLKGETDYNYNYGLSAWIFLMAQPSSFGVGYSKFTKVLDYAGKPTIWYNPEINTLKITTNAYKKDKTTYEKTVYKTTDLPLQKWNNIVVNFVGGTLDVFVNKKLVASVSNIIPYVSNDYINIGDNPGISGSVANVTYFSRPISQQKISFFYNNLINKDPPII